MYFVILRSDCNSYKQVKLGDDHGKKIYSGMCVMIYNSKHCKTKRHIRHVNSRDPNTAVLVQPP